VSGFSARRYALALEQCGLLLRDADYLYQNGSYATAMALAAFAREEMGRSQILLDLWRRSRGGTPVTVNEITAACDNHVAKQRAGMRSLTLKADRDTGLGKILTDRQNAAHDPQSQQWKDTDAKLKLIDDTKEKRTPDDRHLARMTALYVEPRSGSNWNRPADISPQMAHDFLQDAVNDYSGCYHRWYITHADAGANLKVDDPYLHAALTNLPNCPKLIAPLHPAFPI